MIKQMCSVDEREEARSCTLDSHGLLKAACASRPDPGFSNSKSGEICYVSFFRLRNSWRHGQGVAKSALKGAEERLRTPGTQYLNRSSVEHPGSFPECRESKVPLSARLR